MYDILVIHLKDKYNLPISNLLAVSELYRTHQIRIQQKMNEVPSLVEFYMIHLLLYLFQNTLDMTLEKWQFHSGSPKNKRKMKIMIRNNNIIGDNSLTATTLSSEDRSFFV